MTEVELASIWARSGVRGYLTAEAYAEALRVDVRALVMEVQRLTNERNTASSELLEEESQHHWTRAYLRAEPEAPSKHITVTRVPMPERIRQAIARQFRVTER